EQRVSHIVGIDNWVMHGGDARHTGRSTFNGPDQGVISEYTRDGSRRLGEVRLLISPGGMVYRMVNESHLRAGTLEGRFLWRFDPIHEISSIALHPDGGVIVGSANRLQHIRQDGEIAWTQEVDSTLWPGSTVTADGSILVHDSDYKLL